MDINEKEYKDILATLDKRTRHTKVVTLTFVYVLFFSMLMVITGVLSTKITNDNSVGQFITAILDKDATKTGVYLPSAPNHLEEQYKNLTSNVPIHDSINNITRRPLQPGDLVFFKKDTTEKIADAIVSIIVSLSFLLFIGYVMRVAIVFIKYYMQLNNDYENQKIAFLLSKGNSDMFGQILNSLRNQTIGFEKTPNLPQEKIITSLIDAISTIKNKPKESP